MRVLLDEFVPGRLWRTLVGHDARTIRFMGWTGKKNGALLAAMGADGFEVLLTVDRSLRHQQDLVAAGVAVVVMIAPSNSPADLLPLIPSVLAVFPTLNPGDVVEITA